MLTRGAVLRRLAVSLLATTMPVPPAIAAPPLGLVLPAGFVQLQSRSSDGGMILAAGDFTRTATTISVQKVPSTSLDPAALGRLRDAQTGLPDNAVSEVLPGTVVELQPTGIEFEMVTPLTGGNASERPATLVRHTIVRAFDASVPTSGGGGGPALVLWAGALESDWQTGDGERLRAAARSFGGAATERAPASSVR